MYRVNCILILLLGCFMLNCTSDGTSDVKKLKKTDYSDLTMYVEGGVNVPVTAKPHQNLDSLRASIMYKYFGSFLSSDKSYHAKRSLEFNDNRVTYLNENKELWDAEGDKIRQIVSTFSLIENKFYINRSEGLSDYFFGTRTQSGDTLVVTRGFSYYPVAVGTGMHKDSTIIVDVNTVVGYSKYNKIENLVAGDTIIYCNVRYLFY